MNLFGVTIIFEFVVICSSQLTTVDVFVAVITCDVGYCVDPR
jgi:hypothetical protein